MKFEMTKPLINSVILIYIILGLVFLLCAYLAIIFISASKYKLYVGNQTLTIKSIIYNTNIPLSKINIEGIKVIDLEKENLKLPFRTNGIALPGLRIGWFKDNHQKFMLYLTDKKKVILIPTKDAYTILFSSKKAEEIAFYIKQASTNK